MEICTYLRLKRLKWTGQIIRKEPKEALRKVRIVQLEGRTKYGRPRMRCVDKIKCDAKAGDIKKTGRWLPWIVKV